MNNGKWIMDNSYYYYPFSIFHYSLSTINYKLNISAHDDNHKAVKKII